MMRGASNSPERWDMVISTFIDQIQFLSTFSICFRPLCFLRPVFDQKPVEKDNINKNGFWSVQGEVVSMCLEVEDVQLCSIID